MSERNAHLRKKRIFTEYEKVLCEYGELAPKLAKEAIYEKVAGNLGYSTSWVRKVIAGFLKK
jgi:hypothetical protein